MRSGYLRRKSGESIVKDEPTPVRLSFVVLALCANLAWAQSDDTRLCAASDGTADQRIAACTRAITSGRLSQADLAITYYNRGIEWSAMKDLDRAISDYTEAIRHNPQYA